MREGVIYFTQPKRAAMWAVTRVFEREMVGEELIEAWQAELARGNYGRYLVYTPHLYLDDVHYENSAVTALSLIHRADHSGWAREWWDEDWLRIPPHRDGVTLDVWANNFQAATRRAFYHTRHALLDRALPVSRRRAIETRWVAGNQAELKHVFGLALRLFARPDSLFVQYPAEYPRWVFAASSPLAQNGWLQKKETHFGNLVNFSTVWNPMLELLERHFVWVGMDWERVELRRSPNEYVQAQREKWGDDWRGNWSVQVPQIGIEAEFAPTLSAHEALEAKLELRDWLQDKVSPRQRANWLSKALICC